MEISNQIQQPLKCPDCGVDVVVLGNTTLRYEPSNKLLLAPSNCSFYCTMCGAIKSPVRALRDLVYIIPDAPLTTYGNGVIEIPSDYQEFYKSGTGVIISVGPGYYDKRGRFHATSVKVGQRVQYDANVLLGASFVGVDGKEHRMQIVGERDIHYICEDD